MRVPLSSPWARIVLLGVPSDVGAGFRRGANLGPQAIRTRLLDADPDWLGYCKANAIIDVGDVFVVPQLLDDRMLSESQLLRSRQALYPDVPAERRAALPVSPLSIAERALALIFELAPAARPLLLGGDHSCAWPAVKALHDAGRRFCIVQPLEDADVRTAAVKRSLNLADGMAFFPNGGGERFLRLPYCALTPAEIDEGVRRLAETVAETRGALRT